MNAPTTNENMNPFAGNASAMQPVPPSNAVAASDQQRAIQEVQAAMVIAKKFPRDQIGAMDRILQACTRPTLADQALYSYNRGGSEVTGPSIRLAEAIAQSWGNMQFGIRELSQANGESTVEAFAWDVETNTRQVKVFQVPHIRYTRNGSKRLEDPRDVYEMVANQGARRMRACILGVVPGDVIESAVKQCESTLNAKADTSPEAIQKMVDAFADYGVTAEHLKKRIGNRLEAIRPAQVVQLRKIYNSLRDGMSKPADWFDIEEVPTQSEETAELNEKLKGGNGKQKQQATAEKPATKSAQPPAIDPDDVILSLKAATTLEGLETAADLIRDLKGDDKKRAQAVYQERVQELKDAA
ncbi:hypothetical protein [Primorskyibacter sedentarius]|uniref:hypothetical protein n=1 Tax=Primorskyibacter sedentarius TaxID=745311 RepID=UPI003EBE36E1